MIYALTRRIIPHLLPGEKFAMLVEGDWDSYLGMMFLLAYSLRVWDEWGTTDTLYCESPFMLKDHLNPKP